MNGPHYDLNAAYRRQKERAEKAEEARVNNERHQRYYRTKDIPAEDKMEFKDQSRDLEGSDHVHPNMWCHRGKK